MTFYKRYTRFLQTHYGHFIFISLFYSVWLVSRIYYSDKLELHAFPNRMIGDATLQGIDVGARVSGFYLCAAVFILFNIACSLLAFLAAKKEELFYFSELKVINYTSLAGIIIYFYKQFFPAVDSVFELIYALQKIAFLLLVLKVFMWDDKSRKLFDITLFSLLSVVALCFYFFVKEISMLLFEDAKVGMFNVMSLFILIGYSVVGFISRKSDYHEAREKISRFFFFLIPIALLPLLTVLKDEVYLVLNRHQVYALTPKKLYFILSFLLAFWIFYRVWKGKKKETVTSHSAFALMAKYYFPMLLLGLTSFLYYEPVVDSSDEMFELANRALPVMEYYKFGTTPLLEKFNAHFLCDILFGFIFAFFNGFHGMEFLAYDFLFPVIAALLFYWLVYKISGNPYVALFFVLFFPLSQVVAPEYFSFAIIGLWVLNKFLERAPSMKGYLVLLFSLFFLMLWRIDIGYPVMLCYLIIPVIYYLHGRKDFFNRKNLFVSIGIFAASMVLLLIYLWPVKGIAVFDALTNTLSFLSSSQAYGYALLGDATEINFKMQYYFFPLAILALVMFICFRLSKSSVSRRQRFIITAMLFLCIFYIINFQRGLVRHSFREGADLFLSSFLFLSLSASVYFFFYKKSQVARFLAFVTVSTLLVFNYRYPAISQPLPIFNYRYHFTSEMACVFDQVKSKTESFPEIIPALSFDRNPVTPGFKKRVFADFKKYTSAYLKKDETFIDFSNSPMLHFYTGKETPSFFYHNPFHLCNNHLQEKFIAGLANYKTPLLVFSHFPETIYDNVDGPPNAVKHFRVAEHFYNNYEPSVIVNNYCFWKKKDDKRFKNNSRIVFRYDSVEAEKVIADTLTGKNFFRSYVKAVPGKKYFFKVNYKPGSYQDLGFYYFNLPYSSTILGIPPAFVDGLGNAAYYVFEPKVNGRFSFYMYNVKNVVSMELCESDYLPDFYSTAARSYSLNKLPFIWANYDDSITRAKTIASLANKPEELRKGLKIQYKMPENINKSRGNYVKVKLLSNNTSSFDVRITYGNKEEIRGEYIFAVNPGEKSKDFMIRVSTQYNWYQNDNNTLSIEAYPGGGEIIVLQELSVLEGD